MFVGFIKTITLRRTLVKKTINITVGNICYKLSIRLDLKHVLLFQTEIKDKLSLFLQQLLNNTPSMVPY